VPFRLAIAELLAHLVPTVQREQMRNSTAGPLQDFVHKTWVARKTSSASEKQ